MLAKLAFRNVARASRDYAIYFITVALGVALFYAFNAVHSQTVLFDALSADSVRMFNLLTMLIGIFSVVVAFVLGFLVVYANRFLIRRRRREFGMYLLLGMGAGRVSGVLLCETALVGVVSLAAGLVLGIAVSQGLSFATAALMGTTMTKYRFIVSTEAVALTVLCFVAIFVASGLVDVIYIRRCKLVTLLSAREANEGAGFGSIPLRTVGFAVSVALLGCAYWQLAINGMQVIDGHFWAATALMLVGTFLFFWSVAGFSISLFTRAKGVYLKAIRMFTVRQIASKINTAFLSMGLVCVLLFFALTTASVGMGLYELFAGNIEETTRYDATFIASAQYLNNPDPSWMEAYRAYDGNMAACVADRSAKWPEVADKSAQIDSWASGVTYQELLDQVSGVEDMLDADVLQRMGQSEISVIPVSQYNASCDLIGEPGIELGNDEFAIDNTVVGYDELGRAMSGTNVELRIADTTLLGAGLLTHVPLDTSAMSDAALIVVVPDEVVATLRKGVEFPKSSTLNVMYKEDRAKGDAALAGVLADASPLPDGASAPSDSMEDHYKKSAWPITNAYTGRGMVEQSSGLRMVITFLALYIGFVMLVATAAVLAIQQLSETADSLGRYRRLYDLGCELRQIFGSLRTQTVVYFFAPLLLATCHTICAVNVLGGTLFAELGVDPTGLIGIAVGVIVGIYVVYLTVTYLLSKGIVRTATLQRRSS